MKVEEIKKLKSGKYKVKIDNQVLTTYDDVILDNHLLYQKEISEDDFSKLTIDNEHSSMYHKALNYALRKTRSTYEMREYLEKLDVETNKIEDILNHLIRIGILSDRVYVKAYISDSLYLSNDGPDKIRQDLLDQQIEEELILEEMDKIDSHYVLEKLTKLIQKRLAKDHKHSNYQLKQKIILDMVNLGYSRDMILEILSSVVLEDSDKLAKEYENIRRKLERKYEGRELFRKIQEKLYSKGFDIHEIETFIEQKKSEEF